MQKAKEKAAAPQTEAERDGPLLDLSDSAVKRMIAYQLGRRPRKGEVEKLVAFLESLTGDHAGRRLRR